LHLSSNKPAATILPTLTASSAFDEDLADAEAHADEVVQADVLRDPISSGFSGGESNAVFRFGDPWIAPGTSSRRQAG